MVCTGLHSTGRVFGKGQKGHWMLSGCYGPAQSRDPLQLAQSWATTSLSPRCPSHRDTALCGREVWGRLSHSSAFFFCSVPNVRWKTSPEQPLVPPSQALST